MKKKSLMFTFVSLFNEHALGLRSLYSILADNGCRTNVVFFSHRQAQGRFTKKEVSLLCSIVDAAGSDCVMISVSSGAFNAAKLITGELNRNRKKRLIVWGGIHPTLLPEGCIYYNNTICVGEGEGAVLDIKEALLKKLDITGIKNLWLKRKGMVIKNKLRPPVDLNNLPLYRVRRDIFFIKNNSVTKTHDAYPFFMMSRGCFHDCTFCCNSVVKKLYGNNENFVRVLSIDSSIKNLIEFKKAGINKIIFADAVWPYMEGTRLKEFSRQYKKWINLPFSCALHPNSVSGNIVHELKRLGCKSIFTGIQSASYRVRKKLGRFYTDDVIIKAAGIIHKYNLLGIYDFIEDNPMEGSKHFLEKKNLVKALPRGSMIIDYNMVYFPKTDITRWALENKKIQKNQVEGQSMRSITFDWNKEVCTKKEFLTKVV